MNRIKVERRIMEIGGIIGITAIIYWLYSPFKELASIFGVSGIFYIGLMVFAWLVGIGLLYTFIEKSELRQRQLTELRKKQK